MMRMMMVMMMNKEMISCPHIFNAVMMVEKGMMKMTMKGLICVENVREYVWKMQKEVQA